MKGKSKRMKGRASDLHPKDAGVYSGAGSNVIKEANEKGGGFKRGGRVHGKAGQKRLDHKGSKKARGGAVGGSPFSTASKLSNLPSKGGTDSHED